ncbi:hypothetical protein [Propionivibrio sp.]|uniref:hypothetical protein n=1 Tax=Propionivibrio sp. TaxID=2212460 RepID=UPI003BF073E1
MRSIDSNMAIAVRNHWHGVETPGITLCPLLADLDRLLIHLDAVGMTPGDALLPCPECGDYHRWMLLKELLIFALDATPPRHSKLLAVVNGNLDEVRAMYGGADGYRKYKKDAAEFFARVGAGNNYSL